jgi:hypothetical protein
LNLDRFKKGDEKQKGRSTSGMQKVIVFFTVGLVITAMIGCVSLPDTDVPLSYSLSILSTAGGSVAVTVDGEDSVVGPGETEVISDIPADTDVEVAASPGEGYEFVEWLGEPVDDVTRPVTTIDMQDDYEITAAFQEIILVPTYELTMAVSPLDGGTATDETNAGPYPAGAVISIKAVANIGYEFDSWTAPVGAFDNPSAAETTFTMPGQAVNITANFGAVPLSC